MTLLDKNVVLQGPQLLSSKHLHQRRKLPPKRGI